MKNTMRNKINLVFSSFLVIGYIVCTFFFSSLADRVGGVGGSLIQSLILVLFGLLLFYATRVGEGKQVKRFSLAVLLLLVVPCVYIIAASFLSFLPLHDQFAATTVVTANGTFNTQPIILMLACVGLGYGVPYTFLSGYELKTEEDEAKEAAEEEKILEGGLAEELAETEAEAAAEAEEVAEEAAEEAEEAVEAAEDAAEDVAEEAEKTVEEAEPKADEKE